MLEETIDTDDASVSRDALKNSSEFGPQWGHDLLDESVNRFGGQRIAEVHHEVLDTSVGMMMERSQQLFGILVGLWKRVFERGRDLDIARVTTGCLR
jgi:hypothetical protein